MSKKSKKMSLEKAQSILRKWAYESQRQYTIAAFMSGGLTLLLICAFYSSDDLVNGMICVSFFVPLTVFLWLKGKGKWGSNYMEKMEKWIQNPDQIVKYKSKLIHKADIIDIDDYNTASTDAIYKITFTFSDQSETSIKVTLRDKRSFIPALKVVFPQLDPKNKKKTKEK